MDKPCLICGHHDYLEFGTVYDYRILECSHCGLKFVNPQPTDQALYEFYNAPAYHSGTRYQKNKSYNPWNRRIEQIRKLGFNSGRILDVGCATGHFLKKAMDYEYDVFGIDLSESAIKKAVTIIGPDRAQNIDLLDISSEREFDIITMWALIEHLRNPEMYLRKMNDLLRPGGLIAFSTPNVNAFSEYFKKSKWKYYIPPEHLFYFDTKTIAILLNKYGFELIKIQSQNNIPAWVAQNRSIPIWYNNKLLRIVFKIIMLPVVFLSKIFNRGETMEVYARKTKN